MTLGPLMLDLEGTELQSEEREMLLHPLAGGVILFTRNYASPEQLAALISEIHSLRSPRLLVAVDHEGGRVQRFRDGFTALPAASLFGEIHDANPAHAKLLAEEAGWLMAVELRAVGVDFSFAPVLDVNHGVSAVIGDRSFHRDPEAVTNLAHAYMIGMHRAGMQAVGKHFPGHGGVTADTHLANAEDRRTYQDLYTDDILPFERMCHFGLAGVMTAHILYPEVDQHIATCSRVWLQDILRRRIGFEGVIFSDDMNMDAAKRYGNIETRVRLALDAGCDMALICNNREEATRALRLVGEFHDAASSMRLVRMHGKNTLSLQELRGNSHWRRVSGNITRLYQDMIDRLV